MESNSLILGRIPGSGSGLRKTYLESKFIYLTRELASKIWNGYKLYYNPSKVDKYSDIKDEDSIEMEVLEIHQFFDDHSYQSVDTYFVAEVIEKDVLLRHLRDERMILEDMRNKDKEMSL